MLTNYGKMELLCWMFVSHKNGRQGIFLVLL